MIDNTSHRYILVAPSGTGKTTMSAALEEMGLTRCVTFTTRPPRPEEILTDAYYFEKNFDGLDMFEQSEFGGYQYGITREALENGDFVILEPQGVAFYRENFPGPLTVISLQRDGIDVDAARRERDIGAGFDQVDPDITVRGETIEEMRENLIAAVLSYEMDRRRDTGISYLPDFTDFNESHGAVRLFYTDSEFDLGVLAEETHREYHDFLPYYGYDGISCFESADYDRLMDVFTRMAEKGRECTLDFHLQNKDEETMYFCRLSPEFGRIQGELYPYYLRMQPFCFSAKTAKEALGLAFGGFVAAENTFLAVDHLHGVDPKDVDLYRRTLSEGRFEIHKKEKAPQRKASLAEQIRGAEKTGKINLEKMFASQHREVSFAGNER